MFGGNDPVLFSGRRGEGVRSIECRLVVAEFIVDYSVYSMLNMRPF